MISWNQVTFKESTDQILPNLDEVNQAVRRIAFDINTRMSSLQNAVEANSNDAQLFKLINLTNTVQSAATVISSASTALGTEYPQHSSVTYGSDFGDCFPSEHGETMLRWISSNTVYEFDEEPTTESSSKQRKLKSNLQPVEESTGSEQSDSDSDLEVELLHVLMKHGKEKHLTKDYETAERLFRTCLTKISSTVSFKSTPKLKLDVMELLLDVYRAQEKWNEAQSLLMERISLGSREKSTDNSRVFEDMLTLVDVLIHKKSYAEALLYGRRSLKGYRKMGPNGVIGVETSLVAIIRICHEDANYDEEDAYAVILSDFQQLHASKFKPTEATDSSAQRLESPSPVSSAPIVSQETDQHRPGKQIEKNLVSTTNKGDEGDQPDPINFRERVAELNSIRERVSLLGKQSMEQAARDGDQPHLEKASQEGSTLNRIPDDSKDEFQPIGVNSISQSSTLMSNPVTEPSLVETPLVEETSANSSLTQEVAQPLDQTSQTITSLPTRPLSSLDSMVKPDADSHNESNAVVKQREKRTRPAGTRRIFGKQSGDNTLALRRSVYSEAGASTSFFGSSDHQQKSFSGEVPEYVTAPTGFFGSPWLPENILSEETSLPIAASFTRYRKPVPPKVSEKRVEILAIPETMDLARIDGHSQALANRTEFPPTSNYSTEVTAMAKKGRVVEETGAQNSRGVEADPSASQSLLTDSGAEIRRKLVVVGDMWCGKTALLTWVIKNKHEY